MKYLRITACSIGILFLAVLATAQNADKIYTHTEIQAIDKSLPKISAHDIEVLSMVKAIEIPAYYNDNPTTLPWSHDNSGWMYMRPVFTQIAYECGQAAGIGYNFTYEINRLRNVSSATQENQYPTHFAWDWLNNAGNTTGVNCIEAWNILKDAGTPNVLTYGGMNTGGTERWMSGYNNYYSAMQNRVLDYGMIEVATPEGLNNLKQWLVDHFEGSAYGGLANFYANLQSNVYLPANTPEAGKCVVTQWAPSVNHCMTIVGYNDSIRFDYNGDGQYTNNIDINADGIVDMRDWEIGGLKFVNSYGTGYYNNGYCYMMYKTLADPKILGGIWNNRVFVVNPKTTYSPKATFKITIKHNSRNKLKVMAGVAADTNATAPEHWLDFPIINYQGNALYMQGGTSVEANKTLEFGLDITTLINYLPSGATGKYFFVLRENDPQNLGTGLIQNFSLMDYSSGTLQEIPYPSSGIPITENWITSLAINRAFTKPNISITNLQIPTVPIYQPFSYQMNASGGNAPYYWKLEMDYTETTATAAFPGTGGTHLYPNNNSDGFVGQALPFEFPFYGKKYAKVYAQVDGYLRFDDQVYPWPFVVDELNMMKSTTNISPYMCKPMVITTADGDGIWYEGNSNYALFRWKTSIYGFTGTTDLNFAVKLYPSGKIEYYYGPITTIDYVLWTAGISDGDDFTNHIINLSNVYGTPANTMVALDPVSLPTGLQMRKDGLLYGIPEQAFDSCVLRVYVRDNDNFATTRDYSFSTRGFLMEYVLHAGTNDTLEFGETAHLDYTLWNIGQQMVPNASLRLRINDPYVTMIDSVENFTNLNAGDSVLLADAVSFSVSTQVPDNHVIECQALVIAGTDTIRRNFHLTTYGPILDIIDVVINDNGNGYLDPGEITYATFVLKNKGGAKATNLFITITSWDTNLILINNTGLLGQVLAHASGNFIFNIKVLPSAPLGHVCPVHVHLTADNQVVYDDVVYLTIGLTGENFESGNFSQFSWTQGGDAPWFICDSLPYEGTYCAQSGDINDNDDSYLYVGMDVLSNSSISFYRRVSCEPDPTNHNYDYLGFYIDNALLAKWDGEKDWDIYSANVSAGYRTFKWNYHKDYSVSNGKDAAWIDKIIFPVVGTITAVTTSQDLKQEGVRVAPNPFRLGTTLFITAAQAETGHLFIYDYQGRLIRKLVDGILISKGLNDFMWDARDDNGNAVPAGIYFFRLSTPSGSQTGKLIKLN